VAELVPALLDLMVLVEDAVHGTYRAVILPFIQKGCIDLLGRLVREPVGVENVEHSLPFV
jgi:hypothetical protein